MKTLRALLVALLAAGWLAPAHAADPPLGSVDTVHHDLTVALDPDRHQIRARDVVTLKGQGVVAFALAKGLHLVELRIDGQKASPWGRQDQWLIKLPPGEAAHEIAMEYGGSLPGLPRDAARPSYGAPVLDPQGSYLPPDAGWYPLFDVERITFKLTVESRDPHVAVAPGHLAEESRRNGINRVEFHSLAPLGGIVLLAGPYQVKERRHGALRLRTYFYRELADQADDFLDRVAGYIDRYAAWIGPYPHDAFHVVAGPLPVGLGFPGLTYIGAGVLKLPFIRATSLGHEVLHNWWGNGVTPDYRSGNWSEGLTTFMADYDYARREDAAKARALRQGWLADYAALPMDRDRPVRAFISKTHDAAQVVGYGKTAFVFHMLRAELGETVFDAALRRFWESFRIKIASWDDLRRAFEAESGRSLDAFFAQWLDRPGAPSPRLIEARPESDGVALTLTQDAPFYALDLPVTVTTTAGEQRFTVRLDGEKAEVRLSTAARPTAVAIDPDYDVFRRLAPGETPPIFRDVALASGATVLIAARDGKLIDSARELAKRVLDTPPRFAAADPRQPPAGPLLVIGSNDDVEILRAAAGWPAAPAEIVGQGSARAWAARDGSGRPLMLIAAQDGPALDALTRPLPHYGRQGYLAAEGSKVIIQGQVPPTASPLVVRFP